MQLRQIGARNNRQVGVDPAWQDAVDADALGSPRSRQTARELDDTALGGRVCGSHAESQQARHRADGDNRSAAVIPHMRIHSLAARERTGQVGVNDVMPFVHCVGFWPFTNVGTRIGHQDVHSTQRLERMCHQRLDVILSRDVSGGWHDAVAQWCKLLNRGLGLGCIPPREDQVRARFSQSPRDAQANTAIAASDDCYLALQVEAVHHGDSKWGSSVTAWLKIVWAIFVVGGVVVGTRGAHDLTDLTSRVAPPSPATAPQAAPIDKPALRDFDTDAPPFAPAGSADATATGPTASPREPSSPAMSGRLTILLMGIDQRPDEMAAGDDPGRTDSMVLASLDFDARVASMVSIPRDGFVVIPRHGNERINAAYTYGELDARGSGPELAKKTVSQLFNVPVDRYALVDIHAMEAVIDTLGGVWIDNPNRLIDREYPTDDYRTMTIDIPAGRQLMNGVTAVQYARTRHPDSDFGRQGRQQQVLLAIRDQALQISVLPRLPQLIGQAQQLARTDLTPVEIAALVNLGRGLNRDKDIIALSPDASLTPTYTGAGGASYINLTPAYRAAVHTLVIQPRVAGEHAAISVYNAGAPIGTGSSAADLLGRSGLPVAAIAPATERVTATRVQAGAAARQTATLIAQTLHLSSDALEFAGDRNNVDVLLGPDVHLTSP